jgi:hypothetical protein
VNQNYFSALGIPEIWSEVLGLLPPVEPTPPSFNVREAPLMPAIAGLDSSCPEAFRGAVAFADHRVLAIPFCANQFALIDAVAGTARWIGPTLPNSRLPSDLLAGNYGGAVLGCDARIYVLPHQAEKAVMRVTEEEDGGFTFDRLPLSDNLDHFFSGGVLSRPCAEGLHIIASGLDGLYALEPTEGNVAVTPLMVTQSMGLRFQGVTRVGDARVASAPAVGAGGSTVLLKVDARTRVIVSASGNVNTDAFLGIAPTREGDSFVLNQTGTAYTVPPGAGSGAVRSLANLERMRWPTNSLTGWVFAAGNQLIAWSEHTPPPADLVLFDPAVTDTGAFSSGGLLITTSGVLVSVPATSTRSVITLYTPVNISSLPAQLTLSPWFNKL